MQQLIEENMSWNDMIGEWQVKGIGKNGLLIFFIDFQTFSLYWQ